MKTVLCGILFFTFLSAANAACTWTDAKGNACSKGTSGCLYLKCDRQSGTGVRG